MTDGPLDPPEDELSKLAAKESPKATHKATGRFGRFAKLSGMTATVAARTLGQKVAGAFQTEESREEHRRRTLETNAKTMADTMGQLKGAAMKVGQMLSADPDLLPKEMAGALAGLQSEAPPMDLDMVHAQIRKHLGGPVEEFYSWFSPEPIGAASIGQVHRATTIAGEDVAVKVQYPGVRESVASDLKNLSSFLNLARVRLTKEQTDAYLQEVTEVLERESNYLDEADSLERFRTVLKDVPGVRVPTPFYDLTREEVLTMEFIEGERLVDWVKKQDEATRTEYGERLITAFVHMMHVHGVLHADPHPGNFLVDMHGDIVFLDLGCVRQYPLSFSQGLAKVLIAHWRGDVERMMSLLKELGFRTDTIDPEVAYEWFEIVLEPLLKDVTFDFNAWSIHDTSRKFMLAHPSLIDFHPPPEAIFYLRVLAGLRGIMGNANICINAHRLSKTALKELGIDERSL